MARLSDGCPRCGSKMMGSEDFGKVACTNHASGMCGAVWMDFGGWERECIARDLDGTRELRVGADYLDESLQRDLHELVSLTALMTLQTVREALVKSINGRRDIINHNIATTGMYDAKLEHEIGGLEKMLEWLEGVMKLYGGAEGP